jgi:tetratricopeptide (TPR) repeat protein
MSGEMDRNQSQNKPLALEPIDPPASNSDAEGDVGAESAPAQLVDEPAKAPDKFLAAAIREYAKGRVNQKLWASIAAKTGGDEKATRSAYLVARATELRLALRDSAQGGSGGEAALPPAEMVQVDTPRRAPPATPRAAKSEPTAMRWKRAYIAAGAALVAFIVVGGIALMRAGGDAPSAVATMMPKSGNASRAAQPTQEKAPAEAPGENLEAKVRSFADAGNWNMVVIFANEWTRSEPSSVVAWLELSRGYATLRQFDDAVRAAKKTVELSPQDASLWRNLAELQAAANDVEAAFQSYERASTIDPNDVESVVQVGILNTKYDRMPAAKAAFDKVLAANPAHVDALCGQQLVAQRDGRAKDADAFAAKLRALDAKCRDWAEGATVAVRHPGAVAVPSR